MRFAIMGTGGMGGYYGGLLARSGEDVAFIARGAHLKAIQERGLKIKSVLGNFEVRPAQATDDPACIGQVDVILFTTKTYQTEEAAWMIKPMVGPKTTIVSFQNGIDAAERIGAIVGMEHMLGGATWCSAAIEEPGVIGHYSQFRRIALGELDGKQTPRLETLAEAFRKAGATVEISEDIRKVLWTKFAFIAPLSLLGSLTRLPLGDFRSVPESRTLLIEAIREVVTVARKAGINLDEKVIENTLIFIDAGEPGLKASMQRDVETGKPSELEAMIGTLVRMGEKLDVPTPVMKFGYAVLKPRELKVIGAA
ncbi:MAG TPA: 2-dehydropantoate 2-reductase [Syntrophales bacterium]|nr:2-dehydropantoate 2-reductase [Syntrophales bacterium]HOL59704.1 2-dehydropantoate 2-reductase [Syntrophales bacterium]